MRRTTALLAATVTALTTVVATASASADPADDLELQDAGRHGFAATIRYTEYGIPHIKASNYGGLGYGYAFAAATDNICAL